MRALSCLFLFSLLLAACAGAAAGETAPQWIVVCGGQSNMVGKGAQTDLPAELKTSPPNVVIWRGGHWTPLTPAGEAGPEFGCAHALAKAFPNVRIGLVKHAVGGTSLAQWDPDRKGGLFSVLAGQVQAAKKSAPEAKIVGMLWMQGERDSKDAAQADKYAENFKNLIERCRKEYAAPEMAFVFGQVNPPAKAYPHAETVRKAQAECAVPKTKMVSTDGCEKKSDQLHYNGKGQAVLGARMGAALLELIKPAK